MSNTIEKEPVVLSIAGAAKMLGVSVPTMRKLLASGEIPYNRSAHKYFILRESIEKWCNSKGGDAVVTK